MRIINWEWTRRKRPSSVLGHYPRVNKERQEKRENPKDIQRPNWELNSVHFEYETVAAVTIQCCAYESRPIVAVPKRRSR